MKKNKEYMDIPSPSTFFTMRMFFNEKTSFPASRHLNGLNCGGRGRSMRHEGAAADPSCYKAPKDRVT